MNDVTKNAVRELRKMTKTWKTYGQVPTTARMTEIVEAACAMMEGDNGAFGNLIEFATFKCDKCGEEQRAMAGVKSMHNCPQDRIADFLERAILGLLGKASDELTVTAEDQVPAAATLYGKIVVMLADAVCDAAYPQPKKETA